MDNRRDQWNRKQKLKKIERNGNGRTGSRRKNIRANLQSVPNIPVTSSIKTGENSLPWQYSQFL